MLNTESSTEQTSFCLLIKREDKKELIYPLEKDSIKIGSSKEDDITLTSQGILSSHITIEKKDDIYRIENALSPLPNSENMPIEVPFIFSVDDTINIGNVEISLIESVPEPSPEESSSPDDESKTQFMQVETFKDSLTKGRMVCVSGSTKGMVFELQKDQVSIGRDSSNDICIEKDGLSRAHAMIEVGEETITIIDFQSTNGTFVKGKKISTETVESGTLIQFANATFRYESPKGMAAVNQSSKASMLTAIIVAILVSGAAIAGFMAYSKKQSRNLDIQKKQLEELAKTVKETTSPEKLAEQSLELAEKASKNGEINEAITIVNSVLAKHPDHPSALLMKGRLSRQLKLFNNKVNFEKGLKLYKLNEFKNAQVLLEKISPEYSSYKEARDVLKILSNLNIAEEAYSQALKDFHTGDIKKSLGSVNYAIKLVPVFQNPIELKDRLVKIDTLLQSLNTEVKGGDKDNILKQIIELAPRKDNYFHRFAEKKLNEMQTGKNLKAEIYYAKAIEAESKGEYANAYSYYTQALELKPNLLKIKISFNAFKNKRAEKIKAMYEIALILKENDLKQFSTLCKKIIDMGKEENPYYDSSMKMIES